MQQRKNLGEINGPIPRGWNPVTHEDQSLRTGAPGLGVPRMSGEAGYLSPASPPIPLHILNWPGPGCQNIVMLCLWFIESVFFVKNVRNKQVFHNLVIFPRL